MTFISSANISFPRDLDVSVQTSRPQGETTTDLTVPVAVVQDAPFDHDNGRVRIYSTMTAVEADFAAGTEGNRMALAFFNQSPRAARMAIGRAFQDPVAAFLLGDTLGTDLAGFTPVTDGEFEISIDGDAQDILALDFSSDTDLDDVAATIQTGLQAVGSGGFTAATATIVDNQLRITSGTTGDLSTVTVLSSVSGGLGTDISGAAFLNATVGSVVPGYAPTGIADELANIYVSGLTMGVTFYGWSLEVGFRNVTDQEAASDWVQARRAILTVVSNSALALLAGTTSDIGSVLKAKGNHRTFTFWSDTVVEYPSFALLAYMLHVNYRAANSTVTAKFKNLIGITPAGITESELTVLTDKRYNVLTLVGNSSRTVREGVQAAETWFIDDLINLDNYEEVLQSEVYNVFLRNGKVPYTPAGVVMIYDAIFLASELFRINGTFAARPVLDPSTRSGTRLDPAFEITNTPIQNIPTGDRVLRTGPPFTVEANLASAIHKVSINVKAFS
ncbi:MAG: DUF3383 family protein [Rhodobacteraceae bacterium]|nr:DUF3383 family protein [Paracoccaceae bacterium]